MRHRNLVPRQESRVAVALCASGRHILASNGRSRFAGSFHIVDGAVAGHAFRSVRVADFRGLPVDAGFEGLHFVGMTLQAFTGNQFFRGGEIVDAAVTRSACRFAEDGVGAGGEGLGLLRMAGGAFHFGNFGGMREFFDGGVAVFAAKNGVCAGGMFGRVDGNVFSGVGFHSRLAMAGQTILVSGGRSRKRHNRS